MHNQAGEDTVDLYDRYAMTILAYICGRVTSRQDAEDLLLDVFLAAFQRQDLERLTPEEQLAWLRRVAHNKVVDWYRHTSLLTLLPLERALETVDEQLLPEQRAERREQYERLYFALQSLTPLERQVIHLRYSENLRLVEIAALLQKPEGTLRKFLSRLLRRLRALYEQAEQREGNVK